MDEESKLSSDTGRTTAENAADSNAGRELSARSLYFGIFLTSMGVLLLEISLTRIFSYTLWHHFTYVTISLAMLGFGASGAILASSDKLGNLGTNLMRRSALIGCVSVPVMLVIISKVPFHPMEIMEGGAQIFYMAVYYLFVTLPFFCAGLTISCAFKSIPENATKIYLWDLVGAGLGCLAVVGAIKVVGVPSVTALSGCLFLLAAVMFVGSGSRVWKIALLAVAVVWIPLASNVEKVLEFNASQEKWISRTPNKTITFSKWSPIFRVDAYDLPDDSMYRGERKFSIYGIPTDDLPTGVRYSNIAHDGDGLAVMIESDKDLSTYKAFDKSLLKIPYLLNNAPDVLIIGAGGGVDVGTALYNHAHSVLAIELDPITVDLVGNKYDDFVGRLYDRPNVRVEADEGRSFLRRSNEMVDLIQMTGVDTLAALNSGAYVLAENYLYTTDAYMDFMDHLNPDGMLSVVIFDFHYTGWFPCYTTKQIGMAMEALKKRGIKDCYKHIAVISASDKGVPMVLILTKMSPFTREEIGKIDRLAEEVPFDVWHMPGVRLDNPCSKLIYMQPGEREEFYRKNPLRLRPPTDDSPFFFNSFKWIPLIKNPFRTGKAGVATGQVILLVILVFSVIFSIALIIFPLFKFRRAGLETTWKWNYILYFAALGLGFIFIEISYIQRFILFLGYPTYSLTVVLFGLLTFSGIGSYLSGRLSLAPRSLLLVALCLLATVTLGYMVLLPPIFDYFLGASRQVRIAISLVLLVPLGLLLGMFFPTGLKIVTADDTRFIPWAWGINGCASVIGTVLSIIIAMSYGFSSVTIFAVIIYVIGVGAMFRACRMQESL